MIFKVQYPNGEIYEGKWSQHYKREGPKGKMLYANGDVYLGDWAKDKRQGQGKMNFVNGSVFTGEFKDDNLYSGKLIDKHGNEYSNIRDKGGYFLRG